MNEEERKEYIQNLIKNDEVCMIYRNMKDPFSYNYKKDKE